MFIRQIKFTKQLTCIFPSKFFQALNSHKGSLKCFQVGYYLNSPHRIVELNYRNFCSGSSVYKYQDSLTQEMTSYLKNENCATSPNYVSSVPESSDHDMLIPKYLLTIATDPYINHANILKIFDLYAASHRPLMQEKIHHPEEFKLLLPASEQSLKYMDYLELKQLSESLSKLRNQKLTLIDVLLTSLCQECSSRISEKNISLSVGIQYFEIILEIYGNGIASKPYYGIFIEFFTNHISEASKNDLTRLIHYTTLSQRKSYSSLVKHCLDILEETIPSSSLIECAIIANSVKRSGMTLNNEMSVLPKLADKIIELLPESDMNISLNVLSITAIIELMRLSRYFSNKQLTLSIENFISLSNENISDGDAIPTFLAYLANCNYNEKVFRTVEDILITKLQDHSGSVISLARLARIMWAFSVTDHRCSKHFIEVLVDDLLSQVAAGNINTNLLKFVDCQVSLAIMGHFSHDLCEAAFKPQTGRNYSGPMLKKLQGRLNTLSHCLTLECPGVYPAAPPVAPGDAPRLLDDRPGLAALHNCLAQLVPGQCSVQLPAPAVGLASLCLLHTPTTPEVSSPTPEVSSPTPEVSSPTPEASSPTPEVSSPELTLPHTTSPTDKTLLQLLSQLNDTVYVEVLDAKCTVDDTDRRKRLTGSMNCKLRHMQKLGLNYIFIDSTRAVDSDSMKLSLMGSLQNFFSKQSVS